MCCMALVTLPGKLKDMMYSISTDNQAHDTGRMVDTCHYTMPCKFCPANPIQSQNNSGLDPGTCFDLLSWNIFCGQSTLLSIKYVSCRPKITEIGITGWVAYLLINHLGNVLM